MRYYEHIDMNCHLVVHTERCKNNCSKEQTDDDDDDDDVQMMDEYEEEQTDEEDIDSLSTIKK